MGRSRGFVNGQNYPASQFSNLQFGNGKGGKDNKPQQQKGGLGQQKGGHLAQMQMKGAKDFKLPLKDQKSVKFKLQEEEFDASDDDFDVSDDYDEYDEDFDDDEDEFGHGHHKGNNMMPNVGNGYGPKGPTSGMINGHPMNAKKGGGDVSVNFNKGGDIDLPFHGKSGNGGKKGGGDSDGGGGKKKKGGKDKGGSGNKKGGAKSGGGLLGFLGFGKKSKKGEAGTKKNNKSNSVGPLVSGGGNNKGKEGKKGGGKFNDFHDIDVIVHNSKGKGGGIGGKGGNVGGGGGGKVGQMGPSSAQMGLMNDFPMGQMGPMGNFPMDQTRDFSAMHGLPGHAAMNGGYNYQGQAMHLLPHTSSICL